MLSIMPSIIYQSLVTGTQQLLMKYKQRMFKKTGSFVQNPLSEKLAKREVLAMAKFVNEYKIVL